MAEDGGKKDTMVDVVFKKALKEFRLNIFNSYSTALAVSTVVQQPWIPGFLIPLYLHG